MPTYAADPIYVSYASAELALLQFADPVPEITYIAFSVYLDSSLITPVADMAQTLKSAYDPYPTTVADDNPTSEMHALAFISGASADAFDKLKVAQAFHPNPPEDVETLGEKVFSAEQLNAFAAKYPALINAGNYEFVANDYVDFHMIVYLDTDQSKQIDTKYRVFFAS